MRWKSSPIIIAFVVITISCNFAFADCPSADLTGDCFVDFEDFSVMAAQWPEGYDWTDVNTLATQWLTGYPNIPDDMVYLHGGEFEMGDHFGCGRSDELPVHAVLVGSFFMSKYEVTNQQYCDYLNDASSSSQIKVVNGRVYASSDSINFYPYFCTYSHSSYSQITYSDGIFSVRTRDSNSMAEHPVVWVSWRGAVAYCNWRSEQEGYDQCYNLSMWKCDFSKKGYRLPTEAEWEYSARGGCHSPYYKYPWCDNTIDCTKTNFYNGATCNPLGLSSYPHTARVGYYSANNFGLYDMGGNVCEWCNDWYGSDYYSTSPYDNPTGPGSGDRRINRGGGWTVSANYCRIATRSWAYPSGSGYVDGFRVVLDLY